MKLSDQLTKELALPDLDKIEIKAQKKAYIQQIIKEKTRQVCPQHGLSPKYTCAWCSVIYNR